jgi:hypothetical protein
LFNELLDIEPSYDVASNIWQSLIEGMVTEGIECLRRVQMPRLEAVAAATKAVWIRAELATAKAVMSSARQRAAMAAVAAAAAAAAAAAEAAAAAVQAAEAVAAEAATLAPGGAAAVAAEVAAAEAEAVAAEAATLPTAEAAQAAEAAAATVGYSMAARRARAVPLDAAATTRRAAARVEQATEMTLGAEQAMLKWAREMMAAGVQECRKMVSMSPEGFAYHIYAMNKPGDNANPCGTLDEEHIRKLEERRVQQRW